MDFIPSSMVLSAVDSKLRLEMGAEGMLGRILDQLRDSYDAILIDTCPSLGSLTINALAAADEVIIAVNPQLLAMLGLHDFIKTVGKIRNRINNKLQVAGILLTMCDTKTNPCKVITEEVAEVFRGQIRIFKSMVPSTVKADAPKRKIFSDAVDLLAGDPPASAAAENGIEMLDINGIRAFHDHPFHLYEGERLDDMVESIREHGILNPVIVRKMHYGYEMLSGHNRQNAGRMAGLKQIPAIVKENLSDQDAYVYVIETNLMQRSFTDLSITEKAAVLAERYDKYISGMRLWRN